MEANREESLKCLQLAQYAIRLEGDKEKAKRLAIKSNQLFPSNQAQELLKGLLGDVSARQLSADEAEDATRESDGEQMVRGSHVYLFTYLLFHSLAD